MAQHDARAAGGLAAGGAAARCTSAGDLLKDIEKQISDFEAQKLTELKVELEAFVKTQEGLVKAYTAQYPELRRRWCTQHTDVQTLYAQLKCTHDPGSDQWKELVVRCICEKQKEVDCLAEAIAKRKLCSYGPLERKRERAKLGFDAAKGQLDILKALAGKLDTALTDHGKWIMQIKNLAGPERATVLYLFWFRLLPSHRRLMPEDLGSDCKVPGDDEAPEKICKAVRARACEPEPGACKAPDGADGDGDADSGGVSRLPWLMPPADYETALDCAWDDYRKAKKALADAEAEFKNAPDDLNAKIKEHAVRKDALEADIVACLKEWKQEDPCCGDSSAQPPRGV